MKGLAGESIEIKDSPVAFDIDRFIQILEKEYKTWDAPVITMMAGIGSTPFEILVATLISLRTKDEVTAIKARELFQLANTPVGLIELGEETISKTIYPAGFYKTKASRLIEISRILIEKHTGQVPDTLEQLLALPGVGRKTANLVLVEGFKKPGICVDTHVHRISNRIGYVKAKNPDQTEMALRKKLPKKHWVIYNEILVAFGQKLCRPISPFCSKCSVSGMCKKVGVIKTR